MQVTREGKKQSKVLVDEDFYALRSEGNNIVASIKALNKKGKIYTVKLNKPDLDFISRFRVRDEVARAYKAEQKVASLKDVLLKANARIRALSSGEAEAYEAAEAKEGRIKKLEAEVARLTSLAGVRASRILNWEGKAARLEGDLNLMEDRFNKAKAEAREAKSENMRLARKKAELTGLANAFGKRAVLAEARAEKAEAELRRLREAVAKRLNDKAAELKREVDKILRWLG